jgi:hypothetical protein
LKYKTSEAQRKANEKWKEKNKNLQKKYVLKSNCKRYIKEFAEISDLEELEEMIKKAKKDLT